MWLLGVWSDFFDFVNRADDSSAWQVGVKVRVDGHHLVGISVLAALEVVGVAASG